MSGLQKIINQKTKKQGNMTYKQEAKPQKAYIIYHLVIFSKSMPIPNLGKEEMIHLGKQY